MDCLTRRRQPLLSATQGNKGAKVASEMKEEPVSETLNVKKDGFVRNAALLVFTGLLFSLALSSPVQAEGTIEDPLKSPVWEYMQEIFFEGEKVVMDERVRVVAPPFAENNLQVPISINATALGKVEEIIVIVDLNPIPKAAHFYPMKAKPYLGMRLKMGEASAIRAAARTPDGVWHLGGVVVDAAGGGCTTPAVGKGTPNWEDHLGEVQAKIWHRDDGSNRVRMRIIHPMDTGLVDNIPAFYIETLNISDENGTLLSRLDTYEPVSEDPVITLEIEQGGALSGTYKLAGRDNNGNEISARIGIQGL
jgi:sulfur-oxidizing protein SoxY